MNNSFISQDVLLNSDTAKKIAWGIQDPNQLAGVYDPGWGMTDPDKAFVFVDNHDNQRGHGGAGTEYSTRLY